MTLSPRIAIATMFLCFGATIGLWGGSVAEVARRASLSAHDIGTSFVGFGIAGILGMAIAGRIGTSVSLKHRLLVLVALTALCLALLFHVHSKPGFMIGLFMFSLLAAGVDLVMNAEGLSVERERGFPVLSGFHGLASLGLAAGAIVGSYVSVRISVSATAAIAVLVYGFAMAMIVRATPDRGPTHAKGIGSTWFRPEATMIALALIVGASIAGEISASMFSAQTLASQAPQLAAWAGAGATAFALCQATVRLFGDHLRTQLGDVRLMRVSLLLALAGFAVVTFSTGFAISALGFALVGVGTGCIVPCGFALAARSAMMPIAAVISMVAMIGAGLRIGAPLAYGYIADGSGYASAFVIYAVVMAAALALAFAMLHSRRTQTAQAHP
jgi:predicted MFS family arabinose efflux permease